MAASTNRVKKVSAKETRARERAAKRRLLEEIKSLALRQGYLTEDQIVGQIVEDMEPEAQLATMHEIYRTLGQMRIEVFDTEEEAQERIKKLHKIEDKTVASTARRGATGAKFGRVKGQVPADAKAKATTIRLNPELQKGLELLQAVLHKPLNKLVNEAVAMFVNRRKAKVEADLEVVLGKLKAYKRQDTSFEQAIQQFAEAEASLGGDDPVEGKGSRAESSELGPTQKKLRQLLGG